MSWLPEGFLPYPQQPDHGHGNATSPAFAEGRDGLVLRFLTPVHACGCSICFVSASRGQTSGSSVV